MNWSIHIFSVCLFCAHRIQCVTVTLASDLDPRPMGCSNLKPLKITSNDAPMSAAIADQSDVKPKNVKTTKMTLIESERAMFIRMMLSVLREWATSQGMRVRSSDMRAMSAVSRAVSLPAAPIPIPRDDRAIAGASFTPSPTIATRPYYETRFSMAVTLSAGSKSA